MNKIAFKMNYHKCAICDLDNYELLDVHRIAEGQEYSFSNCICLCCNCHRKHHSGMIKILSKKLSTGGYVLNFIDESGNDQLKLI